MSNWSNKPLSSELPTIVKKTPTEQRDGIMDAIAELRRLSPGKTVYYTFDVDVRVSIVNLVCERLRWNGVTYSLTPYPQRDSSELRMSVIVGEIHENDYSDSQ